MAASTRPSESPTSPSTASTASTPSVARRHRAAGRASVDVLRLLEVGGLSAAIVCSVVAVLLTVGGQRPAAIAVAAVGLVLAVVALVAGRFERPARPVGRHERRSPR